MESSVPFNEFQKLMGDDIEKKTTEEPKIVELEDNNDNKNSNVEVVEVSDEGLEDDADENEEVKENEEKKVQFKDPIKEEKIIENNEERQEQQEEKPPEKTLEEKLQEYLVDKNLTILFATISNSDTISLGYHQSMTQLATHFTKLNIIYDTITIHNEPISARTKNCVVAKVLSDDKYTHLMFIDTNVTFSWRNVLELILKDKDVSGGATPKRNINWDKVKETVIKNNEIENAHLYAKSLNYHFAPIITKAMIDSEVEGEPQQEKQQVNMEDNMVEVHHLKSNFMLIKRNVLETMAERLGIMLKFTNSYEEYNDDSIKDHFYSFFERERTDNGYVDEDETFCKRWSKCKGQMWVDLMFNLNTTYYNTNVGSLYLSSVN